MNKKRICISAFFALITSCGYAQVKDSIQVNSLDEVVISDTKFAQSKEKSGKVITKITAAELQKKSGQSLATVLSSVAGVEINGNQSANGKNLGYYIRGGKNQQVLIVIDGNPVTDASGISFEYDLRLLPIDQIESIEIMKGAASTLYGSGAATAVLNITLKKSSKKPLQATAYLNIGSNNTSTNHKYNGQDFNQGFSVNGTVKKVSYLVSLNSTETNGMSQIAEPNPDAYYDKDRFSRINYRSKVGFKATQHLALDFFGNYDKVNSDYDFPFDNTGLNDTDKNHSKTEQFRLGFSPKYTYNNGEFHLNTSFNKIQRAYQEYNLWTLATEKSAYEARSISVDAFNKYRFNSEFSLITGSSYQFHDMNSETPYSNIVRNLTKFNMIDPYVTGVYTSESGLNVNAGLRLNVHSQYGNQLVYNINPSYHFGKEVPVKILSSISTAFITPSLYQLYSEYGTATLTPEKNTTIESGFEVVLLNRKLTCNAVGFYREQHNSIGFDATYHYANIQGLNKAKGIETTVRYDVNSKLNLNANYTFTQVDEALNRLIPKHKINGAIDFSPTQRLFLNASYQYVDGRQDAFFDGNTYTTRVAKLGSYQLVNALVKYELIKTRMSIFGTLTNILNADFVENIGYSTRGRNFKLGLNITL
ncbi:TonB-dependent receptor plug domain-containing protein [Flavobacterium aciduliphilum]|uniref:Vitamin B12 transporter n=1 Tax=Flavobacterium aciduliphilum TaxID=1101402 RepID=A0A328YQ13_9FLAO|nr:TonB-dependent receptor plug domain-containing protein [Flavobacterium aciduliphilum]RAR75710.1 vitamin B12 transporter [Flavobacterium aciduliphilum]